MNNIINHYMKKIVWLIEMLMSINIAAGADYGCGTQNLNKNNIKQEYPLKFRDNLYKIMERKKYKDVNDNINQEYFLKFCDDLYNVTELKKYKDVNGNIKREYHPGDIIELVGDLYKVGTLEEWNSVYNPLEDQAKKILISFIKNKALFWKEWKDNEPVIGVFRLSKLFFEVKVVAEINANEYPEKCITIRFYDRFLKNSLSNCKSGLVSGSKFEDRSNPNSKNVESNATSKKYCLAGDSDGESDTKSYCQFELIDLNNESNPKSQFSLCSRWCDACSSCWESCCNLYRDLIQRIGECLSPQRSANSAHREPITGRLIEK